MRKRASEKGKGRGHGEDRERGERGGERGGGGGERVVFCPHPDLAERERGRERRASARERRRPLVLSLPPSQDK